MKKLLAILVCLTSASAFALGNNTATAISGAHSSSNSGSVSGATQGNSQGITFNTRATDDLRTVATVYAPPIGVTAPCYIGLSGGITVMGFGASLGGSMEDKGCTLRETSRLLFGIGQTQAAAKVMCNNPEAAVAMGPSICPLPPPEVTPLPASSSASKCNADPYIADRMNVPVCK
jgi:hypothetical protein